MRRLLPLLLLCACGGPEPVRVGAKAFTEQRILAQMLAARITQAGLGPVEVVECGDTYACQYALRAGRVDLMVEYTGTGLHFAGAPEGGDELARLREVYAPLGVEWLTPLGFDNSYALVVGAGRARDAGWKRIEDLAGHPGLRVAAPREYLRRPRDGLNALVNRHGLKLAGDPLIIDDPGKRFAALSDGKADVVVGYATDAAIADLGLRVLEDSRAFFPDYRGVVVARSKTLQRAPGLADAVAPLEGRLTTRVMRGLNAQAQVEGRDPRVVARRFLAEAKLLDEEAVCKHRAELRLTYHEDDDLGPFLKRARSAVRTTFPDRPVALESHAEPVRRVRTGDARMAIVGAERFFRQRRLRKTPREERLEAVAVLGTRMLHVVRRAGDAAAPFAGKVGAPPEGSGAAQVADVLLGARKVSATRRGPTIELLAAVRKGDLDAALVFAPVGAEAVTSAFAAGGLALRPVERFLDPRQAARVPYLRPARVRPNAYANQPEAVDTVEAQVLLAGPRGAGPGGGGPAAALTSSATPLTADEVRALAEATRVPEAPDPALPSAWQRIAAPAEAPESALATASDVVLNLLAVLFLFWLVRIVAAPKKEVEAA